MENIQPSSSGIGDNLKSIVPNRKNMYLYPVVDYEIEKNY